MDGLFALTTADGRSDDRRKGLQSVLDRPASEEKVHQVFELTPTSWLMEVEPLAIRGSRLSLSRGRLRDSADSDRPITLELLTVIELGDGDLMRDVVNFDPDDIDAAVEELDARYLAGEAAAYAHTWSLVAGAYAALNRCEVPATTPDWANIDHRRGTGFAPGEAIPRVRSAWDVAPDINIYIVAVHRLSTFGAVLTYAAYGTSGEGFDAEWREVHLVTFEGDVINRLEFFEEADLDAALARFDELERD